MDNLLTATFEAHHAGRNHHRLYQVTVGSDLFDAWTIRIRYGRTGQPGRELRFASPEVISLQRVVRDRLRRQLSAPRRIGTPYRLVELTAIAGFDTDAWLAAEVMRRLAG